jgi:hypothetical protein
VVFRTVTGAAGEQGGSFPAPSGTGGVTSATRLLKPDHSVLATGGPSADAWPKWIKNIQLGTSGSSTAGDNNCARFSASGESATCTVNGEPRSCGVSDYYRVSEYDCNGNSALNGSGISTDRVFIRVEFDRDPTRLAIHENVLLTLQYAASVAHREPRDPSQCFDGGAFNPSNDYCSDMSWAFYLRGSATSNPAPFLFLVPTATNQVSLAEKTLGTAIATKQFIIPLASDTALTTLQISRQRAVSRSGGPISGTAATSNQILEHVCVTNSPFCMGMVFYSMTLTRM